MADPGPADEVHSRCHRRPGREDRQLRRPLALAASSHATAAVWCSADRSLEHRTPTTSALRPTAPGGGDLLGTLSVSSAVCPRPGWVCPKFLASPFAVGRAVRLRPTLHQRRATLALRKAACGGFSSFKTSGVAQMPLAPLAAPRWSAERVLLMDGRGRRTGLSGGCGGRRWGGNNVG